MNTRPLIRKEHSTLDTLKSIFIKIAYGRTGRELSIPDYTESAEFVSLIEPLSADSLPEQISKEELLSRIYEKDLKGLGGAGFSMGRKLEEALKNSKQGMILIINGVECDPGHHHDHWILSNKAEQLAEVTALLRASIGLREVYLTVKKEKAGINIDGALTVEVPDAYPAGEEKQLLKSVLGLEPDSYNYPSDKGVWIQNVQSILSLHAMLSGRTADRYLTMTDLDNRRSVVVECETDAGIADLTGKVFGPADRIYKGGGLLQSCIAEPEDIVDERVNLVAVGTSADFNDGKCRHCSRCSIHCPAGIDVENIIREKENGGLISEEIKNRCLNCGSCSYICPAGKDLCSMLNN